MTTKAIDHEIIRYRVDDKFDNWFVAPCTNHRNNSPLDDSNFETMMVIFDEKKIQHESFYDHGETYILVHPNYEEEVQEIEDSLESYPALDDTDLSDKEYEVAQDCWSRYGCDEFVNAIAKQFDLSDMAKDLFGEINQGILFSFYMDNTPYSYDIEHDYINDPSAVFYYDWVKDIDCSVIARAIKKIRSDIEDFVIE